jgi:hypothetical protein
MVRASVVLAGLIVCFATACVLIPAFSATFYCDIGSVSCVFVIADRTFFYREPLKAAKE